MSCQRVLRVWQWPAKKFHALWIPFIEEHTTFRSRFRHFTYYKSLRDPGPITAFDLISLIAFEPRIANYIQIADFKVDSPFERRESMRNIHGSDAVTRLFAHSPYLEHARLDWQTYYAEIEEDLQAARYSQHAAAFLLTLLPNVEKLYLPNKWKPNDATDKLIDAVVCKTNQSHLPYDRPSLARVNKFGLSVPLVPQHFCCSNWASLFLALPRIQFLRIQSFRDRSRGAMAPWRTSSTGAS